MIDGIVSGEENRQSVLGSNSAQDILFEFISPVLFYQTLQCG